MIAVRTTGSRGEPDAVRHLHRRGLRSAVSWSHLSMAAGVNVGPGTLKVGIIAQPHEFQ
jgi:hypothetical protein